VDVRPAHRDGGAAHPGVSLPVEELAEGVAAMLARRPPSEGAGERWAAVLVAAGAADVFLAVACDRSAPGAWERFDAVTAPRVEALLRRRGADPAEAEAVARGLPGLLVVRPASGGARTRIGTWNGLAPLSAWISVVAVREWMAQRRARLPGPEAMRTPDAAAGEVEPAAAAPSLPPDPRVARAVAAALDAAWAAFTPKESLAVLWKHRDGVPQRTIAAALGVGESRVSHLLARAAEKIRAAVARAFGGDPGLAAPETREEWEALRAVVATGLSSRAPAPPLPRDATRAPETRAHG
jgi:DNA-directed RNA polymerase specialized sigma24 family protein